MAQAPLSVDAILTLLSQLPATIIETTTGLGDSDYSRRVEADQWSLVEILAHLRVSADLRGDQRIDRMLTQDEPTIRTSSPRAEEFARGYAELTFWESFGAYSDQRTRLHTRLRALGPESWRRGGMLTGIRPVRYQTVQTEADALVRHEVRHLNQIKRTTELLRSSAEQRKRGSSSTPISNGRNLLRL